MREEVNVINDKSNSQRSRRIAVAGMVGVLLIFLGSQVLLFLTPAKVINWNPFSTNEPIDLVELTWYARQGYSESYASGFDPEDQGVIVVQQFPIVLNEIFNIPIGHTTNEFSLMTQFNCGQECLNRNLSLYLAEIGGNWAVYLNGQEIRSEVFLSAKGEILIHRTIQKATIPIPASAIREGTNTLVLRIIGHSDTSSLITRMLPGLSMSSGYLITDTKELMANSSINGAVSWFQIGVYLFFAIFQFSMYYRKRETYNHYFGMFLITCVIYSFAFSNVAYSYSVDTALIARYMYSTNVAWPFLIGLTVWSFFYEKEPLPKVLKILTTVSIALIAGILFLPFHWVEIIFICSLFFISAMAIYLISLLIPALKTKLPGARQLLFAGLIIVGLLLYANLDWFYIRSGFDLTGWIPFTLALAFMSILIDRFWNQTLELASSNQLLSNLRDEMEIEVKERTSELQAANTMLVERLAEINELQEELVYMALHDRLTGLYNRHYLAETLEREFSRASREKEPVSLLMLDIDHFKQVNDTFGHKAGDEVLKSVGRIILENIRLQDTAFRYGGEEFLIVMPGLSLLNSQSRAESLRKTFEEVGFTIEDKHGQITFSVGVAEFPASGTNPDEVLVKADEALYAAKNAGRNRVEAANG